MSATTDTTKENENENTTTSPDSGAPQETKVKNKGGRPKNTERAARIAQSVVSLDSTGDRTSRVPRGRPLERPFVFNDQEKLKLWDEMWPNTQFFLVHNVNFTTGQPNLLPVMQAEAEGKTFLTDDVRIVRVPGHVLMGINKDAWQEMEKQRLTKRSAPVELDDTKTESVNDVEIETRTTRHASGTIGAMLDD